jgi:uncharacterized phage-associated protein
MPLWRCSLISSSGIRMFAAGYPLACLAVYPGNRIIAGMMVGRRPLFPEHREVEHYLTAGDERVVSQFEYSSARIGSAAFSSPGRSSLIIARFAYYVVKITQHAYRLSGGPRRDSLAGRPGRESTMPRHLPQAIANEFIRRWSTDHPGMSPNQTWLQKMVHVANGWNLAVNDEPLVGQPPEAWDNGPVFRAIWNHVRDWGYNAGGLLGQAGSNKPYVAELSPSELSVVDHVWKRYGQLSGRDLSQLTHEPDTPWTKAYVNRGKNARLDEKDIRDHYVKLALVGRGQSAH